MVLKIHYLWQLARINHSDASGIHCISLYHSLPEDDSSNIAQCYRSDPAFRSSSVLLLLQVSQLGQNSELTTSIRYLPHVFLFE